MIVITSEKVQKDSGSRSIGCPLKAVSSKGQKKCRIKQRRKVHSKRAYPQQERPGVSMILKMSREIFLIFLELGSLK